MLANMNADIDMYVKGSHYKTNQVDFLQFPIFLNVTTQQKT